MKKWLYLCTIFLLLLFVLVSCDLPSVEKTTTSSKESVNSPPVANAGDDIKCCIDEEITLSGEKSTDKDGDSLTFEWAVSGNNYNGKETTIKFSKAGTYTANLTVSDGQYTDEDQIKITVKEKEVAEEELEDEEESPETWEAKCKRVVDGDTIELENGDKVRYIGIDTPESDEYYGDIATEKNQELVEGKTIKLEKDVSDTDKYGRILAYVYIGDIFVNAYLVENGYAQVYTYPPDVKYSDYFLELQEEAREAGRGFWGEEYQEKVAEEEDDTEEETGSIEIVSLTSPIERGKQASITIKTNSKVKCTITVYYKSGKSTAQGLEDKISDSSGNCSWSWKVGTNTTPGDWKIALTAEGAKDKEVTFTVTTPEEEAEEPPPEEPPQEEQQPSYGITVVSLTSPISRGSQASITINTAPNTYCTIKVYYKSGPSKAQGLDPKNSDGSGNCTWSWKVGTRTTPGDWRIVINVQGVGEIEQYFTVTG